MSCTQVEEGGRERERDILQLQSVRRNPLHNILSLPSLPPSFTLNLRSKPQYMHVHTYDSLSAYEIETTNIK